MPGVPSLGERWLLWKPLFLSWLRHRSIHKTEPGLAQRSMGRDRDRQRAGPASRCPAHYVMLRIPISRSNAEHASAWRVVVPIRIRPFSSCASRSWQTMPPAHQRSPRRAETNPSPYVLQVGHVPHSPSLQVYLLFCSSSIILPVFLI